MAAKARRAMSKLFQITEDDLADLERTLPQFQDAMMPILDARLRTKLRRMQSILSKVRWNYGPPECVQEIPCDDDQDS